MTSSRPTPAAVASVLFDFTLRPTQVEAADAVAGGRDTLAVLPTGSGKSAIYQVAGLALGELTLVISPLIALQRDQRRSLSGRRYGAREIQAELLNSTQKVHERRETVEKLAKGELDFLYIGPEQLTNPETRDAIRNGAREVTLFVVDEAHLVSEWGQEFRPEYLRLVDAIAELGRPPILALTATASPPVQADITRRLGMRDAHVVVADFDRPNIALSMRQTQPHKPEAQAVDDRCVDVLIQHDTPALVYALTHARCEALADRLRLDAFHAAPYHGGMTAAARADVQDRFFAGELDVVVATSAFGMGIDKPDIRTVVHAGVPASIDDYYQEIGRAGRDGEPATAVLVHDPRTIRIPRLLAARTHLGEDTVHLVVDAIENAAGTAPLADLVKAAGVPVHAVERVVNELAELGFAGIAGTGHHRVVNCTRELAPPAELADQLVALDRRRQAVLSSRIEAAREYAESMRCRRAELLAYFGENYVPPCENCDNDQAVHAAEHAKPTVTGGTPVHHRLWGDGRMLSHDDHELLVYFESVGYKHLTASSLSSGILQPR
ncbi:ATP-dependent DNA helicase RecQ [Amycolatopsis sp. FDAARGOS 1241]|uniref:RecQ family ATP-dependent DNA helicase n=1 Tax=Amycolatopsis sp. FDAARGOS 1241 TaxID=2778070 RepID=UPI0019523571|nr:RecQ family ATP-dependent DNA helicase [Amycolatopsis sp. FDAARGOS 1241]QRP47799.1 ATP-dependent DNA helicase RecQ [Amycolatopsis sp. FDAARGOS 1241]